MIVPARIAAPAPQGAGRSGAEPLGAAARAGRRPDNDRASLFRRDRRAPDVGTRPGGRRGPGRVVDQGHRRAAWHRGSQRRGRRPGVHLQPVPGDDTARAGHGRHHVRRTQPGRREDRALARAAARDAADDGGAAAGEGHRGAAAGDRADAVHDRHLPGRRLALRRTGRPAGAACRQRPRSWSWGWVQ